MLFVVQVLNTRDSEVRWLLKWMNQSEKINRMSLFWLKSWRNLKIGIHFSTNSYFWIGEHIFFNLQNGWFDQHIFRSQCACINITPVSDSHGVGKANAQTRQYDEHGEFHVEFFSYTLDEIKFESSRQLTRNWCFSPVTIAFYLLGILSVQSIVMSYVWLCRSMCHRLNLYQLLMSFCQHTYENGYDLILISVSCTWFSILNWMIFISGLIHSFIYRNMNSKVQS